MLPMFPKIQNELIILYRVVIKDEIISDGKKAYDNSIMADEK